MSLENIGSSLPSSYVHSSVEPSPAFRVVVQMIHVEPNSLEKLPTQKNPVQAKSTLSARITKERQKKIVQYRVEFNSSLTLKLKIVIGHQRSIAMEVCRRQPQQQRQPPPPPPP